MSSGNSDLNISSVFICFPLSQTRKVKRTRKSHVFNDKNGINRVKPKSSDAPAFIAIPKHPFFEAVEYYNEDNEKRSFHCGLRSFTYTSAARGAESYWMQNKTASRGRRAKTSFVRHFGC